MADAAALDALWRKPALRVTLASLVLVAFLFLFVFPTRTYLSQRGETNGVRAQLGLLRDQNGRLQQEAERLQSDAEIERIARDRYNLVKPGERAYAIIPGEVPEEPTTTSTVPATTTAPSRAAVPKTGDANDAPPDPASTTAPTTSTLAPPP